MDSLSQHSWQKLRRKAETWSRQRCLPSWSTRPGYTTATSQTTTSGSRHRNISIGYGLRESLQATLSPRKTHVILACSYLLHKMYSKQHQTMKQQHFTAAAIFPCEGLQAPSSCFELAHSPSIVHARLRVFNSVFCSSSSISLSSQLNPATLLFHPIHSPSIPYPSDILINASNLSNAIRHASHHRRRHPHGIRRRRCRHPSSRGRQRGTFNPPSIRNRRLAYCLRLPQLLLLLPTERGHDR
jgi:hypothetical protein